MCQRVAAMVLDAKSIRLALHRGHPTKIRAAVARENGLLHLWGPRMERP